MKNLTLALFFTISGFVLQAQQVLNGSFEEINPNVSNPSDPYPEHWGSFHLTSSSPCWAVPQTGTISTDSHTGEYCIKMETLDCFNETELREPGGYLIYHPETSSPDAFSNPYSERPEIFSFYYKFISQGQDSSRANILLFNYDSVTPDLSVYERIDTIGYVERYISGTVAEYTQFVAPIEYVSEDLPGFMSISFRTGEDCQLDNCPTGTTLWVDDVDLSGGTLGTNNSRNMARTFSIYPNPSSDWFRIRSTNHSEIRAVTIHDYLGRELKRWPGLQSEFSIDGLPSGTYLVRIETSEGIAVKKLMKVN